jgi:pyruvate,orthophosphate dikinase
VQVAKKGKKVIPEVMIPLIGSVQQQEDHREARGRRGARQVRIERAEVPDWDHDRDPARGSAGRPDGQGSRVLQLRHQRPDAKRQWVCTKFSEDYEEKKIFKDDPFGVLDQEGVGMLIQWAVEKGHGTRAGLEVGICGEHGGEPDSVQFCS